MHTRNTQLSVDELKGKQSVRVTFRLPAQVIELLSLIAAQLEIKQKSLFDQLVEDPTILRQVAQEAHQALPRQEGRRQKTFVISRCSLTSIEEIASQEQIHRDALVEFSIRRLLPVIDAELQKHEHRKIILREMQAYLEHGKQLLHQTGKMLGTNDQLYGVLEKQVAGNARHLDLLRHSIEKGKPMEDW